MLLSIPDSASQYGVVPEGLGAHSSRTMMLAELRLLLESCPPATDRAGYRSAILDDNVLLKQTSATRKESFCRLRELYGLTPTLTIFRSLRDLWDLEPTAQPMIASLCAAARDPMLRASAKVILTTSIGDIVSPHMIAGAVDERYPGRLNKTTLANIGRHTASTWTQSGHLLGRTNKVRVQAESHHTSVSYALLLGYLCGARGEALFQTPWALLLNAPPHILHEQAFQASKQGWLEYRQAGAVTDVGFAYLLREETQASVRSSSYWPPTRISSACPSRNTCPAPKRCGLPSTIPARNGVCAYGSLSLG